MADNINYIVSTDLPPSALSKVALEIYKMWLAFALGSITIGDKKLKNPTGRYAASIRIEEGVNTIAIIADSDAAPQAYYIERGHEPYDMKTAANMGRHFPIHRSSGMRPSFRPSIRAKARSASLDGFATIGKNSPPDSWIIPKMEAYSPAENLSKLARQMARQTGAGVA